MQFSDEFLRQWEHIINEISPTEVPLECIKKIIIKLHGKRQKTINLQTLKKQGLSMDEIEVVLTRTLTELGTAVRDLEFVIDITAVAEMIQPETDKLLNKI